MSILIKGVEMPKKQTLDSFVIFPSGYVAIYDAEGSFIGKAKAFPVPPHGRLIDADALINHKEWMRDAWMPEEGITEAINVGDVINAPTIIPAEEGE